MPHCLAMQFARAWDDKRFLVGLTGKPNDEDDWIRFECDDTDVYVRFFNKTLTLATPMSTHFLNIKMGSISDVLRLLLEMDITLDTIKYKYGDEVFFKETYQMWAPPTRLTISWEPTMIPDVPRHAFECDFTLNVVKDRYPPSIFPELYGYYGSGLFSRNTMIYTSLYGV